jgi:hypothetical protein
MAHQLYHLSLNSLSVGTWLQTVVFYALLGLMAHVIFGQLKLSRKYYP